MVLLVTLPYHLVGKLAIQMMVDYITIMRALVSLNHQVCHGNQVIGESTWERPKPPVPKVRPTWPIAPSQLNSPRYYKHRKMRKF